MRCGASAGGRAILRLLRAVGSLLVLSCTSITDVDAPDVVQPGALENPSGAEAAMAGAVGRFAATFPDQVMLSGRITDEVYSANFSGDATDQRLLPDAFPSYPYATLQQARVNSLQAAAALRQFAPSPSSRIGHMFALAGYAELLLGENVCSGVPLSSVANGVPVFGDPLTTAALFERALADFDSALVYAADSARLLNLGRVGRGRTLVNLGRFADAAAAVALVPTTYVFATEHSASVQPNLIFNSINVARQWTIANSEGGNGLDFRTAGDVRVQSTLLARGPDGVTDVYGSAKYTAVSSSVTLASGIEARLIEAEALLDAGDASGAVGRLNALRAGVSGLSPLGIATTATARVDQLFRERAFWMFLTGHRHGDARRLVRQYGRDPRIVFPSGAYKGGQMYGSDVTFTPNASEYNNPKYRGCLSRDA